MRHGPSIAFLIVSFALLPLARADGPEAAKPGTTGVSFEPGPPPLTDVLAKAKAQKKSVFVDFSADG